jgi:predicted component of type VI protein secretion system
MNDTYPVANTAPLVPDWKLETWSGELVGELSKDTPRLLARLVNVDKFEIHTLAKVETAIGRSSPSEIRIDSDTTVSRRHAIVFVVGCDFYLKDLGSRNGTTVNGNIVKDTIVKLSPDDKISIGMTTYVFSPTCVSKVLDHSHLKEKTSTKRSPCHTLIACRQLFADSFNSVHKALAKMSKFATQRNNFMQTR